MRGTAIHKIDLAHPVRQALPDRCEGKTYAGRCVETDGHPARSHSPYQKGATMRPNAHPPALRALAAHLRGRPAAVLGAPRADLEPRQMLAELVTAFDAFKANQTQRDNGVQAVIDDMNARLAAAHLGGGVGPDIGAGADPAYTSLFASYARSGIGSHEVLNANREGERQRINAAMSSSPGDAGGYLVPIEWDRQVRKTQRALSPFRQIANVVQTSVRGYSTLWNVGGWGSGWVGETASRPVTSTANLQPLTFTHGEVYAFPLLSQQLIDDADFAIENWLETELAEEFERQEGITWISGDGVNKPRGFLTYVAGGISASEHPGGAIATTPSGAAAEIKPDALVKLVYSLSSPYRQNARWLMNSNTAALLSLMKDGQGAYLWRESYIVGQPATLLGYQVAIDENMPNVEAGSMPIAFGDFKRGYVINDRVGIRTLRDPYTVKPFVGFYTTKRVGGGVADPSAIRVLRVAAS